MYRLIAVAIILFAVALSSTSEAASTKPLIVVTKSCDKYVLAFGTSDKGELEGYIEDFSVKEMALMNSILKEVSEGNGRLQVITSAMVCV